MLKYLYLAGIAMVGLVLGLALAAGYAQETKPSAETVINQKDGAELVWVPAGEFLMGNSDEHIAALVAARKDKDWKTEYFVDERPRHTVTLPGYYIYKYTVTVAQYKRFCDETEREMPEQPKWSGDNYPVVNVSWNDATAYAKWAGARLPTEAEWEKAARGTDGRVFPWGNAWNEDICNNYADHNPLGGGFKATQASPGGSYPDSASPFGAQDMAGNVWQWCQDWYDADYYGKSPVNNPQGPAKGEFKVLRGGSWGSSSISVRSACRHADSPDAVYHDDGGFRCVGGVAKKVKK